MRETIKESCSCGAILEFEQTMEFSWQTQVGYRQTEFQKAHQQCRNLRFEYPEKGDK